MICSRTILFFICNFFYLVHPTCYYTKDVIRRTICSLYIEDFQSSLQPCNLNKQYTTFYLTMCVYILIQIMKFINSRCIHIAILIQSPINLATPLSQTTTNTSNRATTNTLLQPPGSEIQSAPSQYEKELDHGILNNKTPVELDYLFWIIMENVLWIIPIVQFLLFNASHMLLHQRCDKLWLYLQSIYSIFPSHQHFELIETNNKYTKFYLANKMCSYFNSNCKLNTWLYLHNDIISYFLQSHFFSN